MTAERSEAVGLVHSSTSDTQVPESWKEIDPQAKRIRNMRHSTITGARLMDQELRQGGRRTFPVMVTLTYAALDSWNSRHVTAFLKNCREWFRRRRKKFHYCWVAELQERGAVHYHVVVWMPKGMRLPKPDKRGWWPHGSTKIEAARNPVGYIAKYVSKEATSHTFPKGLRLHGRGGLTSTSRTELRWWSLPKWARQSWPSICDVRRMPGGGLVCVDTGEFLRSPYRVCLFGGRIFVQKISTLWPGSGPPSTTLPAATLAAT